MFASWLLEALAGIGYLFINPLLYLFILLAILFGYRRVKRERKDFTVRLNDGLKETRVLFYPGIVAGLLVSVVTIGLGVVLPIGSLVLLFVCMGLLLLTLKARWFSPAYTIGLVMVASLFLPSITVESGLVSRWLIDISTTPLFIWAVLLSLFLFLEAFFIQKNGSTITTPLLKKSKRGKVVGLHEANYLWMVPTFLVIPDNAIVSTQQWWPVLGLAGKSYGLVLFPFAIGFHLLVQSMLPTRAVRYTGKKVMLLAIVVSILTVGAYWEPFLAIVAAVVAIIGREAISFRQRLMDDDHNSFFASRDHGMIVLGIIPGSPAEKMGLGIGEVIVKINGRTARTKQQFYEALHQNSAYCKLEVVDHNGELRFVQRALYANEHHHLGILFVDDNTASSEAG